MSSGEIGKSGFGTTVAGATTGAIGRLLRVAVGAQTVTSIDLSSMDSVDKWKDFIAGMKDAGEIRLDLIYDEDEMTSAMNNIGGTNEVWTVTFPDTATFVCSGFIQSVGPIEAPMDDKMAMSIVIKLSGKPTFTGVA